MLNIALMFAGVLGPGEQGKLNISKRILVFPKLGY